MLSKHFSDCVARGEAVSVLYAAEPTIYGRFGYGRASHDVRFTLGRGATQRSVTPAHGAKEPSDLTVRIELFDYETHVPIIEQVHGAAGRNVDGTGLNRPGWAMRETPLMQRAMHTVSDTHPTAEALRIVIVERDDTPVGYAKFKRNVSWQATGPSGDVQAGEVVALDPSASHRLWSVLADFDLTNSVTAFMVPTDDSMLSRLEDTRSITMHHVDNVWARIIDVQQALEARVYAGDMDFVVEITDDMIGANAGRWRITAHAFQGPGADKPPLVTRTTDPATLFMDIRELGTIYLGGPTLASLVAAGLVRSTDPTSMASASVAFGWPHSPMSTWVF